MGEGEGVQGKECDWHLFPNLSDFDATKRALFNTLQHDSFILVLCCPSNQSGPNKTRLKEFQRSHRVGQFTSVLFVWTLLCNQI